MSSGLGLVIRQNKNASGIPAGVILGAQNGLNATITPNIAELGGPLIRDTDVNALAFKLAFNVQSVGVGLPSASLTGAIHKFRVLQNIGGAITDGTAAILAQSVFVPPAAVGSVNMYGVVGTLNLNLAASNITGINSFNATGVGGSLVLQNNNGTASTRRLRALMGGVSLFGNVLVNDVAAIEARATEITGSNTITNLYGLYIDQQASSGVTTSYGIYQASAQDVNYFAGTIRAATGIRAEGDINNSSLGATGGMAVELMTQGGSGFILVFSRATNAYSSLLIRSQGLALQNQFANTTFIFYDDGRISSVGLHNNAQPVTGTNPQFIASGTYTPTLFNTTNISASAAFVCQWIRVGNVVNVSGSVDIDAVAAAPTNLGMSLPIPSTLGTQSALGGTSANGNDNPVEISADTVNNRAQFTYAAIDLTLRRYHFTFQYLIL
jgi:hypothetical protein